jgi:hypothetical protein
MDITGITQAVQDALEARDRRIADLERELADLREQIDEAYTVAAPANLAPEDSGPADWVRLALEKAQADNAAYQERLKSILVGICPVPDPECSVAEECDISGTCQAMHALLAADHPGAELLADARKVGVALIASSEHKGKVDDWMALADAIATVYMRGWDKPEGSTDG